MSEGGSGRTGHVHMARPTRVKNKAPAPRQITAEQIVREAKEREEDDFRQPTQLLTSHAELEEYRLRKRKEFEDLLRRSRWNISIWVKYAMWEEGQKDYTRARSVWERTLEVEYRNVSVWLKYATMEMKGRFINHARNVWDRAVSLLPRVDQLWYKYIHMEEMLGNVAGARQIYERWMEWEPDHQGWRSYIKMELRYQEVERARAIFNKYVVCHPSVKAWVHYAKFEMKLGRPDAARAVYERAVESLGEDIDTELYENFAKFEIMCKEYDRARHIYKYSLERLPQSETANLYNEYVKFEKQRGDREGIEDVVLTKRRNHYEDQIKADPLMYDTWFDYCKLEESAGDVGRVREIYERAIANVPPASEKRYWQRYIYLWIRYALYEEIDAEDVKRARDVYAACLNLIPHGEFSFSKIWILAAKLEIRAKDLSTFRSILGNALGKAPKDKIFRFYIETEMQLGNVDRCRTLYGRYLEWCPTNCDAWIKFAELEGSLGEVERVRSIFELAIEQPSIDMPEALWKAYIDFEIAEGERDRARALYERLLSRTQHVKVWMSYAQFESSQMSRPNRDDEDAERVPLDGSEETPEARCNRSREIFNRANRVLRGSADMKESCVILLEAWRAFEKSAGTPDDVKLVEAKMPQRVKRKRALETEDGKEYYEEYYDYVFPDEKGAAPSLKILEMAYKWKKQRTEDAQQEGS